MSGRHSVPWSLDYKMKSACCGHICPCTAMVVASMTVLEENSSVTVVCFCLLARAQLSSST